MGSSQPTTADFEITESVSPVEFDTGSESLRATYDSTRDTTSLAVVAVVAAALGDDPQDLTPLQTVVDTDALDKLATYSDTGLGACDRISFEYDGYEVTVTSEETIRADPLGNA